MEVGRDGAWEASGLVGVEAAEGMAYASGELFGGEIDGLFEGFGIGCGSEGLVVFEPGLDGATFVFSAFLGVFITEVHLNSGDMFSEVSEDIGDNAFDVAGESFAAADIIIRVYLYNHELVPVWIWVALLEPRICRGFLDLFGPGSLWPS